MNMKTSEGLKIAKKKKKTLAHPPTPIPVAAYEHEH
jgi:hypothetical protein